MNPDTHIDEFFEKAGKDAQLQAKIAEIFRDSARRTAEAMAALSQETTVPFTADQFLAPSGEGSEGAQALSDDSLASVNGGIDLWGVGGAALGFLGALAGSTTFGKAARGILKAGQMLEYTAPAMTIVGGAAGHGVGKVVDHINQS